VLTAAAVDPLRHATLSAQRRGGSPDDYYALHAFFDTTKELCSDNRHRLLHNLWGIRRVAIPLFGTELTITDGARVATKAICEADHVLADFSGKYLPTLGDFVGAIAPVAGEAARFDEIAHAYRGDDRAMALLRSPYAVTGQVQALLVTHNTWFLSEVLPRLCSTRIALPRGVPPSELFARMRFELWMDNGAVAPPSAPSGIHNRRSGGDRDVHHS
jgi:hypothetical protein